MDPIFLLKGLIIGFAMAVPIGPIGIMCIRKTLAEGHTRGLIIGLGAVSRCTFPVLLKHLEMPRQNITVMDFAELGDAPSEVVNAGCNFVSDRLTRDNLGHKL